MLMQSVNDVNLILPGSDVKQGSADGQKWRKTFIGKEFEERAVGREAKKKQQKF